MHVRRESILMARPYQAMLTTLLIALTLIQPASIATAMPESSPQTILSRQPPPAIQCGGKSGYPHFSQGTHRQTGEYQIHAQARNWCNFTPNGLSLGGKMYRSSWRAWSQVPHIGNYRNPTIGHNRASSNPNRFVFVTECEPGTWHRWKVRFGNSALINGRPAYNANPFMTRETPEEIKCGPS